MVKSDQIVPGMILSIDEKLYRVESVLKVTIPKRQPFIKTKLHAFADDKVVEKNFKVGMQVKEASLEERKLEYLYLEGKDYLFLDTTTLDQVPVSAEIIGDKVHFLKEGVELLATFYGDTIYSVELPQFLELLVAKTDGKEEGALSNSTKKAVLETGAVIEVPRFIEAGDVIKVDTRTKDYIQRI